MKIGKSSYYFFLRASRTNTSGKAPIHCRLFIEGEVRIVSTGIFVEPQHWNREKLIVKQGKNPLGFQILEFWKSTITQHFTQAYLSNQKPDLKQLWIDLGLKKGHIKPMGIVEVFRIYLEGIEKQINQNYAASTLKKFKTVLGHLKQFIKTCYEQKDIPLKELKLKHLVEFEDYLTQEIKLRQITINKTIQRTKTVIRFAIAHDYLDKDPWMIHRAKSVSIEIKYLTQAELSRLEVFTFQNPKHSKVRDCFVFACYTGLGYLELKSLNQSHVEERNQIKWLKIRRQKTQKMQQVPLLPQAEEILQKYQGKLPVLSNQKMNEYLKDIGKLCGIQTPISTHLARKTFASTVLLANNVPIKVVSTLLSHSDSRVTEKHYAELQQDVVGQELIKLMRR